VVYLIGYRGCGKSAVGACLAKKLGWGFVDTDQMVEETIGTSIAQCFATEGEAAFRAHESRALEAVAGRGEAGEPLVVATGGGIVLSKGNVARMRASGTVVWLDAPVETLRARIKAIPGTRPALQGSSSVDEVESVLALRRPLYTAAAEEQVGVEGLAVEDVADRVLQAMNG
jgi:shikimate kinase